MASLFKKFFSRLCIVCITYVAWLYSRLVFATSKLLLLVDSEAEFILLNRKPCILLLWHGRLFVVPELMVRYGRFTAVISHHRDGEYLANFIKLYRHSSIRGSSNKGGVIALKKIFKALDVGESIVITPDGPRGPAFKLHRNIAAIAHKKNTPLLILSCSANRARLLDSWDRFMVPMPFTKLLVKIHVFRPHGDIDENYILENTMLRDTIELDEITGLKL